MASKYSIEAVFKLIDQVTNPASKAGRALDKLSIKSRTVSNILKNNFDKAARKVAAATEFDAEQTASALSTMAIDPVKLVENFQYVSDIIVKTANIANMDLRLMYEAVGSGGAQFKKANQRIEDFGAAVDILAAKPGDVSKALQELGIRTQDTQGNMLNFVDIIGQLNVAMRGMGTAKQDEYLFRIFGKNRMNYARPLIDAGVEGFRVYAEQLEDAAGSTQQAAEVMRQSIKNKRAVLGLAATEMGFKFVEAFKDKAVSVIGAATEAIENGVSLISRSLPASVRSELSAISAPVTATRTSPITPRVRMGGNEGASDYYNPRNVAPVTQAERMAYSFSERRETVVIEIAAEKRTAAHVVRAPRDVDIRLVNVSSTGTKRACHPAPAQPVSLRGAKRRSNPDGHPRRWIASPGNCRTLAMTVLNVSFLPVELTFVTSGGNR